MLLQGRGGTDRRGARTVAERDMKEMGGEGNFGKIGGSGRVVSFLHYVSFAIGGSPFQYLSAGLFSVVRRRARVRVDFVRMSQIGLLAVFWVRSDYQRYPRE